MLRLSLRSRFAIAVHCFGYKVDHDFKRRFILTQLLQAVSIFGRYLSVVLCKIMIDETTNLGQQLWLSPKGNIILGAQNIGNNCVIHHNVTLGMGLVNVGHAVVPTVGGNVWIGPNSILYGDIVIGEGATILSGSVVVKSVISGCVVAGNPARIVKQNFDNRNLRSSTRFDFSSNSLMTQEKENPND